MEILKEVMKCDRNCAVSLITAFEELPKECMKVFYLNDSGKNSIVHLNEIDIPDDSFYVDNYKKEEAEYCMRTISNTKLRVVAQAYSLPQMITFLEMYGVKSVEQLNPLKRWNDNNPLKSLSAPVGVATDGSIFTLDLHEKFQGPHGLIAGMTGSGKSEFIITYVLSMAVNYSPNEVAFILIDYKGGGLADAFENESKGIHLPHLVGTITNLDGSSIQRSLLSIKSELVRRQRVFREAKKSTTEGIIDIYEYQKMFRNGIATEPMPHLFIVADEFAELKKQEPDFMDELISAARIGRSLGIHLILATQKPSGIVDDQIWGNSKFKVCLRVQDRSDSNDMLKRPEAAELRNTGRFYLQVGYNEFFALGQSAWSGADYILDTEERNNSEIEIIDNTGHVIIKKKPKRNASASGEKQVIAIVKFLSSLAVEQGIENKKLWLEPIKPKVDLSTLKEQYGDYLSHKSVETLIGVVDDPMNQRQFPLCLDIQHLRHLLIAGESGSGKTTFIQTLLFELSSNYNPEQVNFYVFDFSSHNLSLFSKIPHCGGVLTEGNEKDIQRLLSMLDAILAKRKALFSAKKVGNYDTYLSIEPLALIIVIVDNISAISEFKDGRDYLDSLSLLMRNGDSYGIKVIVTANDVNDLSFRMQRDFGTTITLHLKDRYAYSNALNLRCMFEIPDIKGRGVCAYEGRCLEYQTALVSEGESEIERTRFLIDEMESIEKKYKQAIAAEHIDIEDYNESYLDFCKKFTKDRIPLGYSIDDFKKVAIPLQQLDQMSLYFGNDDGKYMIMRNFINVLNNNLFDITVIKKREGSIFPELIQEICADKEHHIEIYDCNLDSMIRLTDKINEIIVERTVIRKAFCDKEEINDWKATGAIKRWRREMRDKTRPLIILIESFAEFKASLDSDTCGAFDTFWSLGKGYNIYYCALFYPNDNDIFNVALKQTASTYEDEKLVDSKMNEIREVADIVSSLYNQEKFTLLFGGQYDKQSIVRLPFKYSGISDPLGQKDLDKFVLNYRGKLVSMRMPCGDLSQRNDEKDGEDEWAIV